MGEREIASDLRLLFADGTHIRGADVYRYAMRRIPWTYPVYLLSTLPILDAVFDRAYGTFARHRHQVSRICGLPGAGE